jgi:deoxyribodipyrimidine photolyase
MYKCRICGKDTILFKSHIKKHTIGFGEYFTIYPEEKEIFNKFEESQKLIRKQNSPNSIEHYLKKGLSMEEAENKLAIYRTSLHHIAHTLKKSNIKYYIAQGYSKEESKTLVEEYLKQVRETEISNVIYNSTDKISREDAINEIKNKKIASSPRCKIYWMNKGFSEEEAKLKISEYQKSVSPRSELYWINRGYAQEIAKIKVSEFQNFSSITYIMYKHKCNEEEAQIIQKEIKDKELVTKKNKGIAVDISQQSDFANYRKLVDKETEKNYKIYKNFINPNGYNRGKNAFHLDHIYSVLHGYLNNVDYKIIASPYNLRMVLYSANLSKNSKSDISLEMLLEEIKNNKYNYDYEYNKQ